MFVLLIFLPDRQSSGRSKAVRTKIRRLWEGKLQSILQFLLDLRLLPLSIDDLYLLAIYRALRMKKILESTSCELRNFRFVTYQTLAIFKTSYDTYYSVSQAISQPYFALHSISACPPPLYRIQDGSLHKLWERNGQAVWSMQATILLLYHLSISRELFPCYSPSFRSALLSPLSADQTRFYPRFGLVTSTFARKSSRPSTSHR